MSLPLKTRILEYGIDKKAEFTVDEIYNALKPEYNGEKQFTKKRVTEYLDQFLVVKFMEAKNLRFEGQEVAMDYVVTEYGFTRERFLPGHTK